MIWLIRLVLRLLYRFRAYNEQVLTTKGPVLLLANHCSWWDWLFLGVCLETDWRFVTSSETAQLTWFHKRIMVNRRTFPVDMNSPYAVKHMASYLHHGGRLVLFPEGRMSITGSLMKLFEGTGFLTSKTGAKVITVYIRGAERLPFSPNPNRKYWFHRVTVHFSAVQDPPHLEHTPSTEARSKLTSWLQDVMIRQQFETEMKFGPATIQEAILARAVRHRGVVALEDASLKKLTYGQLLLGAFVLRDQWKTVLGAAPRVGLLLPNVCATPVAFLSLWLAGKVPAILNYTNGPATLLACARLGQLRQVVTSRAFLERAQIDLSGLEAAGIQLVYLEEVRAELGWWNKAIGALRARFLIRHTDGGNPGEPALILFTSGSEGEPKGVELSHQNVLANIRQMLSVIDLTDPDRFFNALPLFHSFGLTVGLLLPLIQGNFTLLYVSPLHYRVIPAAFYNLSCTILFGTNTFLGAYGRTAHPYDFHTLRYVFAGAEKLQESTSREWMQKFGIRILEGYGATECSPCLSVNVPMRCRPGSAGRFLPGVAYKLEPLEGIPECQPAGATSSGSVASPHRAHAPAHLLRCGLLLVSGPNIMHGYLNPAANAQFLSLGGWYDTGDVVGVDEDGFVFILGRLRRFAKISGEMVSLAAVEEVLSAAFEKEDKEIAIAVLARPDPERGEKLIVVTNEGGITLAQVRQAIQGSGLSNLAIPRALHVLPEIPRLSTGKVNLRELAKLASDFNE